MSLLRTCVLCNAPLTILEARMGKTCGKPMCRLKYSMYSSEQLCKVCGRPLSAAQMTERLCSEKDCRTERLDRQYQERKENEGRVHAEKETHRIGILTDKLRLIRDHEAGSLGIDSPASYSLVVIPNLSVPIVEVSEERRQAFRQYLTESLKQAQDIVALGTTSKAASSAEEHDPELAPEMRAVLGNACGQCNGHCCRNGRNHAYLTVESLTNYLTRHPEQTFDEIIESYLSHIPSGINEDSCVFHRPTGCNLSREMRGDLCNQFFCPPLEAFRNAAQESGFTGGCFGATKTYEFKSVAFIDAMGVREVATELPQTASRLG